MLNGSSSPSIKLIIISSDNKVMSDLRKMNLGRVFLFAAVSKDAGVVGSKDRVHK